MIKSKLKIGFLAIPLIISSCSSGGGSSSGGNKDYLKIQRFAGEIARVGQESLPEEGTVDERLYNLHPLFVQNTAVFTYHLAVYQKAGNNLFNKTFKFEVSSSEMHMLTAFSFKFDKETNEVDVVRKDIQPGSEAPGYTWVHATYDYETNTLGDYFYVTSTTYNDTTSIENATVFHRKDGLTRLSTCYIEELSSSNPLFAGIIDDEDYDSIVSNFVTTIGKFNVELDSAKNQTLKVSDNTEEELKNATEYIAAIYDSQTYFDKLGKLTAREALNMLPSSYPLGMIKYYEEQVRPEYTEAYLRYFDYNWQFCCELYPMNDLIKSGTLTPYLAYEDHQIYLKLVDGDYSFFYSLTDFRLMKKNDRYVYRYTYLTVDEGLDPLVSEEQYNEALDLIGAYYTGEAVKFDMICSSAYYYNYDLIDAAYIKQGEIKCEYSNNSSNAISSYYINGEGEGNALYFKNIVDEILGALKDKYYTNFNSPNSGVYFSSSYGEKEYYDGATENIKGYRLGIENGDDIRLFFDLNGDFTGFSCNSAEFSARFKLDRDFDMSTYSCAPEDAEYISYYYTDDIYPTYFAFRDEFKNQVKNHEYAKPIGVSITTHYETETVYESSNPTRFNYLLNKYTLTLDNFDEYISSEYEWQIRKSTNPEDSTIYIERLNDGDISYPYQFNLDYRCTYISDSTGVTTIEWFYE